MFFLRNPSATLVPLQRGQHCKLKLFVNNRSACEAKISYIISLNELIPELLASSLFEREVPEGGRVKVMCVIIK